MASVIYYGKSNTPANTQEKEVTIPLTQNENETNILKEGDILVVLFQYGNSVSNPTIRLSNGDVNTDTSLSIDEGLSIKVRSIPVDLTDAWVAGEAKIFVFVRGDNANDYYYEIIGSIKGDADSFGGVKLVNIVPQEDEDRTDIALGPSGVKELITRTSTIEASWNSPYDESQEYLGTLNFNNGITSIPLKIYYPSVMVQQVSTTRDIWNQGPRPGGTSDNNKFGDYLPFLVRNIPASVMFYPSPYGVSSGGQMGLFVGDRREVDNNYSIINPYLIFEVTDNNGNTNIFSKGNITLNAARGRKIITGATAENGRNGNMQINGVLEVTNGLTLNGGFNVKTPKDTFSTIDNLNVSGTLKVKGRAVPIAKQYVYNSTETSMVQIYDDDIKGMKNVRIICTAQDGSEGIKRVNVQTETKDGVPGIATGHFAVYFIQPVRVVSINYLYYPPSS